MLPDKLSFVDIETTGTSARFGRIIEIGIIRVEEGKVVRTYNTLLNPETHIPPEIEMLTGISAMDLIDKPTFRQIKDEILETLIDTVFVAHNVRFDYSFLRHEFRRENIDFKLRHFCTVKLSRALFPHEKHHNLDAVISRFGFSCENRHRAYDDAKILWEFYQKTKSQFTSEIFTSAVNIALRRPNIPIKLSQADLDDLPEQPGVYIFYAENGMPLYVGKSKDIRDRVLSHFSADLEDSRELNIAQQVKSIETIVTAGELGALFLESSLIKKLLPIYNRVLRNKRELVSIIKTEKDGFATVKMEPVQVIESKNLENFLGFFKSRREAKNFLSENAKKYNLCEKLLGLEKSTTECFSYRLDRCNGACIGKEKQLFYNLRFNTAFFKTKIRRWPFEGPVIIKETNELTGISEYFLIDKWCYLGRVKTDQTNPEAIYSNANIFSDITKNVETKNWEDNYVFDLDCYKILLRFLSNPRNMESVHVIQSNKLDGFYDLNQVLT